MTDMRWTRERPTVSGWYWVRHRGAGMNKLCPVRIEWVFKGDDDPRRDLQYAGPVPEPVGEEQGLEWSQHPHTNGWYIVWQENQPMCIVKVEPGQMYNMGVMFYGPIPNPEDGA